MRKSAWLLLGSLLLSSLAFAAGKPRLGTFKGTIGIQTDTAVKQWGDSRAETVNVRVKGKRLYVTQKGGTWVQSFKITGDSIDVSGIRRIQYVRDTGKVGRRNEARLDAAEPGATVGYRGLTGSGSIAVTTDGRMGWGNVGQAQIQGIHAGERVDFPVAWNEYFQGRR